jgi:FecR protein
MHRLQFLAALAVIAAGVGGATSVRANANMVVGNAILIQQDVEGAFNDQDWTQTSKGDDVFEAEFIRTQVNSRANFALFDGSTIGLGATAIMKIDHVVLDPRNHSIQKLIVSAKEGAVRWISGNSMSDAYQIDTPHAVITDEGTAFDLVVEQQRTLVLLHTGRATVCAIHAPGRCKTLSRRGEMVVATTDDVVGPWESGLEPAGFETQCLNAKCAIAALVPPPQPPSDGGRNGPGRLPEPRHAVVPSRPEMGETVVPSEPERGDTPVPGGTPTREVVVPSGPPIPEVLGGLGLWLYTHPGHGGQHGTPPPPGPQYPPPPGTPYPPPRGTTGATPTGTTTTDTKPTGTKPTGTTTTDTRTTGTRTTDTKPTGTKPTGTTTTGTRYQGPAIVRTPTDTKYPASSEPGRNVTKYSAPEPARNVTKYSAPANDTIVAKHPGPSNLMMHSGPPNLTMRSGLLNLMMRSGPPNLMMHPGPPQLHLPGGPFRRFGPPR